MKIICLIVIVGWPFLTFGSSIQKQLLLKEDKASAMSGYLAGLFVFISTQVIYYVAGIYQMIASEL
jgi:hypothetical protein